MPTQGTPGLSWNMLGMSFVRLDRALSVSGFAGGDRAQFA